MKALVPPERADTLDEFFRVNGINLGTFLEALSELITDIGAEAGMEHYRGRFRMMIARAQELTFERSRRKR